MINVLPLLLGITGASRLKVAEFDLVADGGEHSYDDDFVST